MSSLSSKTIAVNGKKLRYFTNGLKGDKPVVILHGFMSDAGSLVALAQYMDVDQPVVVPDLPGFGESEALDKEGLQGYVGWFHDFLKAMKISTPSAIIGYSFGAYVAVLYTSTFPQSTETKLILLTPVVRINWKVRLYGHGFRLASIKASKTAERVYLLQHNMTTRYLRKAKHPSVKSELMERRREELAYFNPRLVLNLMSEFLKLDMLTFAPRITIPTIIVTASKDNVVAADATRAFSQLIRTPIVMIEILHAGHLLPMEEPMLLATTLKSYVVEAPGLASGPTKRKSD